MIEHLKEFRCEIETLSPVHIGDGNKLLAIDYVLLGNSVYVVDEDKLYSVLEKRDLVNRFIDYVEKNTGASSLEDFLRRSGLLHESVLKEVLKYLVGFSSRGRESQVIANCVKDAYGRPYVPGSEIKGAVRTALLYDILVKDNRVKEVVQNLKTGKLNREFVDDYLRPRVKKAIGDLGRLVRFSDSEPVNKMCVVGAYRVSTRLKRCIPLTLMEVIPSGESVSTELTLVVDRRIIGEVGREISVTDIVRASKAKSRKVVELEKMRLLNSLRQGSSPAYEDVVKQLERFYQKLLELLEGCRDTETLIRIGGGQGLYSTTVLPALVGDQDFINLISSHSRYDKNIPKYVRGLIGLLSPITKRPFNVKVAEINGFFMPFGWIKMVFEEC